MAKTFLRSLASRSVLGAIIRFPCCQFHAVLPKELNQLSGVTLPFLQPKWQISIMDIGFRNYAKKIKPKYPPLNEDELEEKFTRGGGPGGQAVATTSNCVLLRHLPTGLYLRCHAERSLELNRKIARRRMQEKLDDHYNGENSIIAQQKLIAKNKLLNRKAKTKKKLERLAAEKLAAKTKATELDIEESQREPTDTEDPKTIISTQSTEGLAQADTQQVSENTSNTPDINEADR